MVENICAISLMVFLYSMLGMVGGFVGSAGGQWDNSSQKVVYKSYNKKSEEEFDSKMLCVSGIIATVSG